jgi:hypothetical protein
MHRVAPDEVSSLIALMRHINFRKQIVWKAVLAGDDVAKLRLYGRSTHHREDVLIALHSYGKVEFIRSMFSPMLRLCNPRAFLRAVRRDRDRHYRWCFSWIDL